MPQKVPTSLFEFAMSPEGTVPAQREFNEAMRLAKLRVTSPAIDDTLELARNAMLRRALSPRLR
jgi:hypothetical protein